MFQLTNVFILEIVRGFLFNGSFHPGHTVERNISDFGDLIGVASAKQWGFAYDALAAAALQRAGYFVREVDHAKPRFAIYTAEEMFDALMAVHERATELAAVAEQFNFEGAIGSDS